MAKGPRGRDTWGSQRGGGVPRREYRDYGGPARTDKPSALTGVLDMAGVPLLTGDEWGPDRRRWRW